MKMPELLSPAGNFEKMQAALLYGVTGSGKTAVYIKLIQETLNRGKQAMLLVPEIALTPQLLGLMAAYFGQGVAVLHSSLPATERYDQWKRIRSGEAGVVVGTRSAVFAPCENPGLIILDEEQEHSYKSENTPRYAAKEVAFWRGLKERALVLLGSATPTVETMYHAKNGDYRLYTLKERYNGKPLPQVEIVDMREEVKLGNDLALSLGVAGVRIATVVGKISVVGIEVPNRAVTNVSLREVIDSPEFARAKSKSSFAVGKDIGGTCIVGNIAKLPHMLIAGTTGSGKSVCMNSIIISLLYKASPEDVKLIMVDPKMVELANYNGIPHLMIPVVTDPKKAAGALQWAVTEMMRRYKAMSDAGVRDLESYNSIMEHEDTGNKLPQIVVIIDELADLMLVAAKEVEESICRIAQMGRAAGIHLIIATQRPSADVITGLMKANIPSRIAFAVASGIDSRTIIDTVGAEKLLEFCDKSRISRLLECYILCFIDSCKSGVEGYELAVTAESVDIVSVNAVNIRNKP